MNPLIRFGSLVAVVAALSALGGCATPSPDRPRDRDFLAAMSAGQRFFAQAQYDLAAKSYRGAWRRAVQLDEPLDVADGAYNLAAALAAAGRRDEARGYLREARAEYERARASGAGESWLLAARLAQTDGRRDEALAAADQALAARGAERDDDLRARALQLKAVLFCEAGDTNAAAAALTAALTAARKLPPGTATHGYVAGGGAALARREGRAAAAAAQYDRAAELFKQAGRAREMADAYGEAAACYQAAAVPGVAGERHYRAARILAAQGDLTNALKHVQAALTMLEKDSNQELFAQVRFLFEQIQRSVDEQKGMLPAPKEGK
jgi:tetratricopeptide (TPR) repeat protein